MFERVIKSISIILVMMLHINGVAQPSERSFKNKVINNGNSQVQIRAVCKGQCKGIDSRLMAEGGIDKIFCFRISYALYHKEGLWKFYNSDGTLRDSAFYYRNWPIKSIDYVNEDGSRVIYNVVKAGPSKIQYYHKDGHKTEEQTFNLSDKKLSSQKSSLIKKVSSFELKNGLRINRLNRVI